MTTLTAADVERIKALAEKAPQGKWMSLYEDVFDSTVSDTEAIVFTGCDYNLRTVEQQNDLAAYIASLSPDVVAQLADAWLVLARIVAHQDIRHRGSAPNAPGHGHKVAGIWDDDNGLLAGTQCDWCALWQRARDLIGGQ